MGVGETNGAQSRARMARVQCLKCSVSYVKPVGGGTAGANPGCPDCGYVGWVLEQAPFIEDAEPSRFFAGRLPRRTG